MESFHNLGTGVIFNYTIKVLLKYNKMLDVTHYSQGVLTKTNELQEPECFEHATHSHTP